MLCSLVLVRPASAKTLRGAQGSSWTPPSCSQDAPFAWPCPLANESKVPADPLKQFDRVMVVTAHPDDEGMGSGLISRFTASGAEVRIVVGTNGDKGTGSYNITSHELAEMRAVEMHNAAAQLNATAVLLGYEDGELVNSYEARLRVAAQVRLFKPQLLLTINPVRNFGHYQLGTEHKDHRTAGEIALDCFYPLARDHLQFAELWQPWTENNRKILDAFPELDSWDKKEFLPGWKISEAYLFAVERLGAWGPPRYETVEVPLAESDLERMAKSLSMHVSQTGGASWQELLPGMQAHTGVLGKASQPQTKYAQWFTRVVNLP